MSSVKSWKVVVTQLCKEKGGPVARDVDDINMEGQRPLGR